MPVQIGKYKFAVKGVKGKQKLCPLCLEDLEQKEHKCLSKPKIVVKKPDYGLIKFTRSEDIVKRMLKITDNARDDSRSFVVLYVNNSFVGYKSMKKTKFIAPFKNKHYLKILDDYQFKKDKDDGAREYKIIR
jgi:hypothetical protein